MSTIKKLAFTLAEVLIVIGIIGIVAEMTIPELVADYQKQIYVTQFKKAYVVANDALKQMSLSNGCISDLGCTGLFASTTTQQSLGTEFIKYFKVSKDCGAPPRTSTCWPSRTNYNYDGTSPFYDYFPSATTYQFITNDGMSFSILNSSNDCSGSICGVVDVDTNGIKPPNTDGRDTFKFSIHYQDPFIYVSGSRQYNYWNDSGQNYCSPSNKDGLRCGGRIIEKNWTMDY